MGCGTRPFQEKSEIGVRRALDRRGVITGIGAAGALALSGCRDSAVAPPVPKQEPVPNIYGTPQTRSQSYAHPKYGMVELIAAEPQLALDIRYATTNNLMGKALYSGARAFLVTDAAAALFAAQDSAHADGYDLMIYDAYRPLSVTRAMWAATPRHLRNYVANPAKGSKHNRGAAVDLTLHDRNTGKPVLMPSDFDDFSMRAHRDFQGASGEALANRARLERYMVAAGFRPMSNEWWHFDFIGWEKYPILDVSFDELTLPEGYPTETPSI